MKLYRSYNDYLRERYGERVHKVSIDAGFTCPNRDGTKAVGGCIYCNNDSFNFSQKTSVSEQLSSGIERSKRRYGARKFIAYFQAYTNTYGPLDTLYDAYNTIHQFPEIVGLCIGTRPDCASDEVLEMIQTFAGSHEVWIEYGLESSNDETLRRINRAHTYADFKDAVLRTAGRGIQIGTHIIVGFPWELEQTVYQTANDIASLPVNAIKIHNLHIVRGTPLQRMYERTPFELISMQDYAKWTARILELLPPEMIVLRLSAECPSNLLVAPDWCNEKKMIVALISEELLQRNSYQGKDWIPATIS
ncbi:TIGR01212 family radical SAM protein [bacterium]|nr:TIGR01212 family radical SAM protein [bacterium]MCI0604909.1 TIGR01212 family radical SAM protein [bacterium]